MATTSRAVNTAPLLSGWINLFEMPSVLAGCPLGFGQSLQPLSYALSQPKEVAIVGEPEAADPQALLDRAVST